MGVMRFIPDWERPPEPNAETHLVDWVSWRIACGGEETAKDVAVKIATRLQEIEAQLPEARRQQTLEQATKGRNGGHGHVWPRADGAKARCGGPAICPECARDLARKVATTEAAF